MSITKFGSRELREYEDSMKAYRDLKNSIDTALEKGRAEGRAEGRVEGRAEGREQRNIEIARKMLEAGMEMDSIAGITGLTKETVENLSEKEG